VIASLDLNSVLSEGVHHDNSSPNPPRRRTAQGAALAAKGLYIWCERYF